MSPAAHRGPLLSLFWRAHRLWYRLSDGRLGAKFQGWDVLLLFKPAAEDAVSND